MHHGRPRIWPSFVLAGVIAGSAIAGLSAAVAGECPADKVKADVCAPVTNAGKGVTDTVLGAIDLEKEPANIKSSTPFPQAYDRTRGHRSLAQPW
jgi:hypothetical protein